MKNFCSYYFILIFSIIPVFLHAQLSVSYQAFQPDDVVIDAGLCKMTAKQLEKYGFEPLKVVMVNDGDVDETCVPDRRCLLPDDVYRLFKHSTGIAWLKGCGGILGYFSFLAFTLIPIMHLEELKKMYKELEEMGKKSQKEQSTQSSSVKNQLGYSFTVGLKASSLSPIKTCFFNGILLVGSILIARYFIRSVVVSNQALISYLHQEMFFESCQIPAHATTTKLMFVVKE